MIDAKLALARREHEAWLGRIAGRFHVVALPGYAFPDEARRFVTLGPRWMDPREALALRRSTYAACRPNLPMTLGSITR